MVSHEDELDDLRIQLDVARRECDMRAVITITERIDHLIRHRPMEIQ